MGLFAGGVMRDNRTWHSRAVPGVTLRAKDPATGDVLPTMQAEFPANATTVTTNGDGAYDDFIVPDYDIIRLEAAGVTQLMVSLEVLAGKARSLATSVPTSADLPTFEREGSLRITEDDLHLWAWDDATEQWEDLGTLRGQDGPASKIALEEIEGKPGLFAEVDGGVFDAYSKAEVDTIAAAEADAAYTDATSWATVNTLAYGSALGTTDLNTVLATGVRSQTISGNATTARNYPPGEYRGTLTTFKDPGQGIFTIQQYLGGFTKKMWQREYYSGTWGAWTLLGPTPAYDDTALASRVTALEQGGTDVATVQEERTVSVTGDYRPDAWATDEGTVLYWTGPAGLERIGWGYRGGGYVGKLAAATAYSTMQVKKVQSTGEVEVSCLNPGAGRHVTHRVQGVYNTGQDEQRRIEETWVGTYTGTTVSKDLLIMPRSNIEWAFQIDVSGNKQFVPYHGSTTGMAYQYEPATVTDGDGDPIDIDSMAVNAVLSGVNGFKVRQRLYLAHPATGTTKWCAVDEVHTISPDGMLQTEAVITFLQDTTLGSNYGPMTPVSQATFGSMKVWGGSTYSPATTPPGTTTYIDITEGHGAQSVLFTSATSPTAFVAMNFLDRAGSLMLGHPSEETGNKALQLEQRSTSGLTKLYPTVFTSGSVIPAGTVWRPAAQWRYGQASSDASAYA